jgi:gamma-glutamylcyclotransferase (GGCT)/AIG2-like uncharacterized protein YtfP
MQSSLVFVYGTLKSGEYNHHLLAGSTFIGRAQAMNIALHAHEYSPFPYAQCTHGSKAWGEVWKVTEQTLRRLDTLEGVPHHYQRMICTVQIEQSGEQRDDVFVYVSPSACDRIERTLTEWTSPS